jgi:two-component system, chemotaxis family, chemotaxis protein CheY
MNPKILVVDDSVSVRQLTLFVLQRAGYDPVGAADGAEALQKLTPDTKLIIADYMMPGMNGAEFIRAVRSGAVNRFVPIVVVTAESSDAGKEEGKKAGATAWITKPYDDDLLLATIKKLLKL